MAGRALWQEAAQISSREERLGVLKADCIEAEKSGSDRDS